MEHRLTAYVEKLPAQFVANEYAYPNVLPLDSVRAVNDIIWGEWQVEKEEDNPPPFWWFGALIELPYRQGALEQLTEINRLAAITETLRGAIPVDSYLLSRHYRDGLAFLQADAHLSIKSLAERTASQVVREINSGIATGLSREEIADNVINRLDVSRSNAARIVDTEVMKAYNRNRLRAVQMAREETGLDLRVQHISALLPTTRKHHADRHMHTYTPQQQMEWWARGANSINCKCSVRSVLNEEE